MGILVLIDKTVPDLLAWLFFAGLIIAVVPALLKKRN